MTSHGLASLLLAQSDLPVSVAGHGALHFVTHAATEEGTRVVVLYVAEPEPVELVLKSEAV